MRFALSGFSIFIATFLLFFRSNASYMVEKLPAPSSEPILNHVADWRLLNSFEKEAERFCYIEARLLPPPTC